MRWTARAIMMDFVGSGARVVVERRNVMTQGVSGPPVALEVHVTGRSILATIVDLIIFSVFYWVVAMLFGGTSVEGGTIAFSLGSMGSLVYLGGVFAYYLLLEGGRLPGADRGQDAPRHKGSKGG
jgi:hypothetical protein